MGILSLVNSKYDLSITTLDNDLLYKMVQGFTLRIHTKMMPNINSAEDKYVYNFIVGGQWNLLVKWVKDGAVATPKEMSKIAIKIEEHFK